MTFDDVMLKPISVLVRQELKHIKEATMRVPVKEKIDIGQIDPDLGIATEQYVELATKLGIVCQPAPADVQRSRFRERLAELDIEVYPFDRVSAYMDAKCKKNLHNWYWLPLRKVDAAKHVDVGALRECVVRHDDNRYHLKFGAVHAKEYNLIIYTKPLPYPAMLRIDEITTAIPEVGFFVTDTEKAAGEKIWRDPFLAITLAGLNELFVIERWDEPGFRL